MIALEKVGLTSGRAGCGGGLVENLGVWWNQPHVHYERRFGAWKYRLALQFVTSDLNLCQFLGVVEGQCLVPRGYHFA